MRKIIISCDSTCDLSKEIVKYHNINIVPLYVTFGDEMLKDSVDITTPELYQKVKEFKTLPKSSAPSPADFIEKFKPLVEEGYDIIHLSIGSGFSVSYQNAVLAAQEFDEGRVLVVDGENLSLGTGILALKASKLRGQGKTAQEIVDIIKPLREKVRTQFVIDTFDYLHKGGRCSSMTKVVGSLLKIKPNVKVVNNTMEVARKARGMKVGLRMMIGDVESDLVYMDRDYIIIGHSQAEKEALRIYEALLELGFKRESILIFEAGCVISTHCGPGAVGIIYLLK